MLVNFSQSSSVPRVPLSSLSSNRPLPDEKKGQITKMVKEQVFDQKATVKPGNDSKKVWSVRYFDNGTYTGDCKTEVFWEKGHWVKKYTFCGKGKFERMSEFGPGAVYKGFFHGNYFNGTIQYTKGSYAGEAMHFRKYKDPLSEKTIDEKNYEMHGKGVCRLETGAYVKGNFIRNQFTGSKQTISFTSGDYYIGTTFNGKMDGPGTYYTAEGETFTGEFENDVLPRGKSVNSNGDKYEGELEDFQFHGRGQLIVKQADGSFVTYKGSFVDGQFTGENQLIFYSCGKKYFGDTKDLLPHGKGLLKMSNGDQFEGNWQFGRLTGLLSVN